MDSSSLYAIPLPFDADDDALSSTSTTSSGRSSVSSETDSLSHSLSQSSFSTSCTFSHHRSSSITSTPTSTSNNQSSNTSATWPAPSSGLQLPPDVAVFTSVLAAAPIPLNFVRRANVGGHSEVILASPANNPSQLVALKIIPLHQPHRRPSSSRNTMDAFRREVAALTALSSGSHPTARRVVRLAAQPFQAVMRSAMARKGAEHGLCCLSYVPHRIPKYRDYCNACAQHRHDHMLSESRVLVMPLEAVPHGDLCEYTECLDEMLSSKTHSASANNNNHSSTKGAMERIACVLFAQLLDALYYMHHVCGLVHRDVKPDNIGLDAHWHARLFDYGHTVPIPPHDGLLRDGICGTNDYASPEARMGQVHSGVLADVWGAGVVLMRLMGLPLREPHEWLSVDKAGVFGTVWGARVARAVLQPEAQRKPLRVVQGMVAEWADELGLRDPAAVKMCMDQLQQVVLARRRRNGTMVPETQ